MILYTLGYNNFSFYEFATLVKEKELLIFDIRMNPYSYNSFWNKDKLAEYFNKIEKIYFHIQDLGNKSYNIKNEFNIVNLEKGSNLIIDYMDLGFNCLLFCACKDMNACHRKIIAEFISNKVNCNIVNL